MTTIGFIGAGKIGTQLAKLAIASGHDVVLSNSRGPETLADLVDELGEQSRAATTEETAAGADVVVLTIPFPAIATVPVEPLDGKILIDTNNYYPQRGIEPELEDESTTTGELIQRQFAGARVVKALNTIEWRALTTDGLPSGTPGRRAIPIASDDDDAKRIVAELVDSFGFDVVDAGALAENWRFQRDTPGYTTRRTADEVREDLAAAKRYRDM